MNKSTKVLDICFRKVERTVIGLQYENYTLAHKACLRQLRKFVNSEAPSKELETAFRDKVSLFCDASYPNTKAYVGMDGEITGFNTSLDEPILTLHDQNLCSSLGESGDLGAASWLNCMVLGAKRSVALAVIVSHPRAVEWLNKLAVEFSYASDSATAENVDARAAMALWKTEICALDNTLPGC